MVSHCKLPRQLFSSLLFCFFIIFSNYANAWNATGHMVVARIAYQNLKPEVRAKVDNLVASLKQEYPDMLTVMNMAYWPDAIRSQHIETFTHWHYINLPYNPDGTPIPVTAIDTDNGVWAVKSVQAVVKNNKANPYDRARFLSFLIHIVGDLHQPLHTAALFSAKHTDGDRGGNQYNVIVRGQSVNLHSLWDSGIGEFVNTREQSTDVAVKISEDIMQRYPAYIFGARATDLNPDDWAKEGFEAAKQFVYNTPEDQAASATYLENGKQLAEQEVALAGYRLANILNDELSDSPHHD